MEENSIHFSFASLGVTGAAGMTPELLEAFSVGYERLDIVTITESESDPESIAVRSGNFGNVESTLRRGLYFGHRFFREEEEGVLSQGLLCILVGMRFFFYHKDQGEYASKYLESLTLRWSAVLFLLASGACLIALNFWIFCRQSLQTSGLGFFCFVTGTGSCIPSMWMGFVPREVSEEDSPPRLLFWKLAHATFGVLAVLLAAFSMSLRANAMTALAVNLILVLLCLFSFGARRELAAAQRDAADASRGVVPSPAESAGEGVSRPTEPSGWSRWVLVLHLLLYVVPAGGCVWVTAPSEAGTNLTMLLIGAAIIVHAPRTKARDSFWTLVVLTPPLFVAVLT